MLLFNDRKNLNHWSIWANWIIIGTIASEKIWEIKCDRTWYLSNFIQDIDTFQKILMENWKKETLLIKKDSKKFAWNIKSLKFIIWLLSYQLQAKKIQSFVGMWTSFPINISLILLFNLKSTKYFVQVLWLFLDLPLPSKTRHNIVQFNRPPCMVLQNMPVKCWEPITLKNMDWM